MTEKEIINIVLIVTSNSIVIRKSLESPYKWITIGQNIGVLNEGIVEIMLKYMRTRGVTYHYFDNKYKEQFELNLQLTGDVLTAKYSENTINNLIK